MDTTGKHADKPEQIPPKGWWQVGKRVVDQLNADHIGITSAGVAFYFFLSLFPALGAVMSIYGLVNDPVHVQEQMSQIAQFLPASASEILTERLTSLTQTSDQALGWGVVLSIALSLWSANKGTKSLFEGINIAYNETSERNFFQENALTLLFTVSGMVVGLISVSMVVGFPALADNLGLSNTWHTLIAGLRWLILALIVTFCLALIYRYAPDRDDAKIQWISWGALISTVLWMAGSWAFSFYVTNFGSYEETYGSVAAVIILLLWFYLTGFIILLGAEINSELEHQTAKDTTKGEPQPMGQRGAYYADRVAVEDEEEVPEKHKG